MIRNCSAYFCRKKSFYNCFRPVPTFFSLFSRANYRLRFDDDEDEENEEYIEEEDIYKIDEILNFSCIKTFLFIRFNKIDQKTIFSLQNPRLIQI